LIICFFVFCLAELNHVGSAIKRASMPYVATASTAIKRTSDKISRAFGTDSIAYYDEKTGERIDPKTGKKWVAPPTSSKSPVQNNNNIPISSTSIESQSGLFPQQPQPQVQQMQQNQQFGKSNVIPTTEAYQQPPAYVGRTQ